MLLPRSFTIATFALCGFANLGSIDVTGGIGALVPERRNDLAKLGVRAMLAGTMANLISASIAGIFLGGGYVMRGCCCRFSESDFRRGGGESRFLRGPRLREANASFWITRQTVPSSGIFCLCCFFFSVTAAAPVSQACCE